MHHVRCDCSMVLLAATISTRNSFPYHNFHLHSPSNPVYQEVIDTIFWSCLQLSFLLAHTETLADDVVVSGPNDVWMQHYSCSGLYSDILLSHEGTGCQKGRSPPPTLNK